MEFNQEIFAERLKLLMETKKISKYKLAKDTHFSQSTIANWRDKHNCPDPRSIKTLCEYFHVTEAYLSGYSSLDDDEEQKEKPTVINDDELPSEIEELIIRLKNATPVLRKAAIASALAVLSSD